MDKWDEHWLRVVDLTSSCSKDRSTKVGCVIVRDDNTIAVTGYNGFPRGSNDNLDERHERPLKYSFSEHAERNAIYQAAKHGIALVNTKLYLRWLPCADCARAIVQSGIKKVIGPAPCEADVRWFESQRIARIILQEGNVELIENI